MDYFESAIPDIYHFLERSTLEHDDRLLAYGWTRPYSRIEKLRLIFCLIGLMKSQVAPLRHRLRVNNVLSLKRHWSRKKLNTK